MPASRVISESEGGPMPGTAAPTGRGASGAGDRYLLGDSTAEVEHLAHQAEVYADEAAQLLDRVGLAEGSSAIDVGCGVLGILRLLCARVGPSGRVVGLDQGARILDAARQAAAQHELPVELIQGDATCLDLPSDSFDFVHERTVLANVHKPAAVIDEMIRIARPGGMIAVQEPDSSGWICDPPHPAWDSLQAELLAAYRRNGKNFNFGRRIARALRDAGLADVQVRVTARATKAGEYYQTFLLTLTGLMRDQIITGGRLTAAEFDAQAASLRTHLEQPGTLTG